MRSARLFVRRDVDLRGRLHVSVHRRHLSVRLPRSERCLFPFPSDYFTVADPTTDTGRRVHFADASMPKNCLPGRLDRSERLQPATTASARASTHPHPRAGRRSRHDRRGADHRHRALARRRRADRAGQHRRRSQQHLHLRRARRQRDQPTPTSALIIHPAVNLDEGTRYIVALRNMKDCERRAHPAERRLPRLPRQHADRRPGEGSAPRAHGGALHHARRGRRRAQRSLPRLGLHRRQRAQHHRAPALHARRRASTRLGGNAPTFTVTQGRGRRRHATSSAASPAPTRSTATSTATDRRRRASCSTPNGLPVHQATPQAGARSSASSRAPRCRRRRHGRAGARLDLRPRPARVERPRSTPATSRAWPTSTTSSSARRSGSAWRTRTSRNAIGILQDLGKFPTLTDRLQQSMLEPALPRPPDDPPGRLHLRPGLPGRRRATR